ncbi:hypothetical protein HK100_002272, partial [Physocladia obscura]
MIYGHTPFQSKDKKILDTQILNDPIVFPLEDPAKRIPLLSKSAHDFIIGLLSRIPTERIGSNAMGGYSHLQKHAWFEGLDWNRLEKRELTAPFVPDVEKHSYHDPRYNVEEFFVGHTDLSNKPVVNGGSLASRRRPDHSRPPFPPPPTKTKITDKNSPQTLNLHQTPPPILPPSITPTPTRTITIDDRPVPDFQQLRKMYLEGMEKAHRSSSAPVSVINSAVTVKSGAIIGSIASSTGPRRNRNNGGDAATDKISLYHSIFGDRVGLVRQSYDQPQMMTEQEEFQLHLLETEFRV